MKKIISILMLLVLLFLIFEWGITFFKKGHEITYRIFVDKKVFNLTEIYNKDNGNIYDIKIETDNNESFYYTIENNYNKQKEIIKEIKYFNENNNSCIYPILNNNEGTYIQCTKNGKNYTSYSFDDQNYINEIKNSLIESGYTINKKIDTNTTKKYSNSIVYVNNIIPSDKIVLWSYKGIDIINNEKLEYKNILGFDKYENSHGSLVNNYYIIPNYLNSKILEFSSVSIIDLENNTKETLDLNNTLSSNTYINGVVDGKLYYTDPSNLIQIEINPKKNNSRLIGNKELGGQVYDGKWKDANIYDFVSNKILFKTKEPKLDKYNYVDYIETNSSYYFYNKNNEVYKVSKNYLDNAVFLFKTDSISSFQIVEDTIYYVSSDTLYSFNPKDGNIPILKNKDLIYNNKNRISIYRKS